MLGQVGLERSYDLRSQRGPCQGACDSGLRRCCLKMTIQMRPGPSINHQWGSASVRVRQVKVGIEKTDDGHTVHSLSTLSLNSVLLPGKVEATIPMLAKQTPPQKRAMELLGVGPHKYVPSARTD